MAFSVPLRSAVPRLLRGSGRALALWLLAACAALAAAQAPATDPATDADADADAEETTPPPGRVGKLGLLSGQVTLIDLQTDEQQPASLNWPITSGQRLITAALARAEIRIGSLALRMDGDSTVDFPRIDDEVIQIVVRRGSLALRARSREILPDIDLLTPRERLVFDDVGRYRIDVDRAAGLTALTVFVGSARIATGQATHVVSSGQRGEIGNVPGVGFTLLQPAADTFDDWVASRDRRDDALVSGRYVSPETTGVESLDDHGDWRTVPDYGPVWYPRAVPVGWAPYRYGRWAYVAPWGWTWIDDAPWGFAPFHYGRWAMVGGAWCWVPGAWVARPVYAPALVAWYGTPGVSVSVSIGAVGWFPLGPREPYIPPYGHNRRYVVGVNAGHVGHIGGGRIAPPPRYMHQTPRTSTWVQNSVIVQRRPVQRAIAAPPRADLVARPLPPPVLDRGPRTGFVPRRGGDAAGGPRPAVPSSPAARPQPARPGGSALQPSNPTPGGNVARPPRGPATVTPTRPSQATPPAATRNPSGGFRPGTQPARPPINVPPPRTDPVSPAPRSTQPAARPVQPAQAAPADRTPAARPAPPRAQQPGRNEAAQPREPRGESRPAPTRENRATRSDASRNGRHQQER